MASRNKKGCKSKGRRVREPVVWAPVVPRAAHILGVWLLEKAGFKPQFAGWEAMRQRPRETDIVLDKQVELGLLYSEYIDLAIPTLAQGGRVAVRLINRCIIFWEKLLSGPEILDELEDLVLFLALDHKSAYSLYGAFDKIFQELLLESVGADFSNLKRFRGEYYAKADLVESLIKLKRVGKGMVAFYPVVPGKDLSLFVFMRREDVEAFIYHRPRDNRMKLKVRGDRPIKVDPGFLGSVVQRLSLYEPKVVAESLLDLVLS